MTELSVEERLAFARIITPEVLDGMSDDEVQGNIDAGYRLVNERGHEFDDGTTRIIFYWLGAYEDERDRRSGGRAPLERR